MRYEREGVKADSARLEAGSGGGLVHLFAFFVMKNRRERNPYLASAAKHEKIVEALTRLSAVKPRADERFTFMLEDRDSGRVAAGRI